MATRSNRFSRLVGGPLVALLPILLISARPATAQDRIGPAHSIRVVELVDASGTRLERMVLEPMTPAEILQLQVALGRAGFDPGVRTGIVDDETEAALRQFQISRGLEVCGCPSYETVLALGIPVDIVGRAEVRRAPGVRAADGSPVYIVEGGFFPRFVLGNRHFFHDHFFFRKPFLGSGVVVGHEPALGAGQVRRVFPRSSVGVREIEPPARTRRGGTIKPALPGGGGSDGGARPPRARPPR